MSAPRYPILLPVDPEHRGIRYAVPLLLFVAFSLSYFVLSAVLRAAFPTLNSAVVLSCLGALPIALFVAWAGEVTLKRVWQSGRRVRVTGEVVAFEEGDQVAQTINRSEVFDRIWWRFPLQGYRRAGRERRMPKDYWCVAGRLAQGDDEVVLFCYAGAQVVGIWDKRYPFAELDLALIYDGSASETLGPPVRPAIPAELLDGDDGRYWKAEERRWRAGGELTVTDFDRLLKTLYPHSHE